MKNLISIIILVMVSSCTNKEIQFVDNSQEFILMGTQEKPNSFQTQLSRLMDDGLTPKKITLGSKLIEINLEHDSGKPQVLNSEYYMDSSRIMVKTLNNQGYIEYAEFISQDSLVFENGHKRFLLVKSNNKVEKP